MNIGDVIQDDVVGHSVDLQRVSAAVRHQTLRTLKKVEGDLLAALARIDPTEGGPRVQQRRLQTLLEQTRETIRSGYRKINADHLSDMKDLAAVESDFAMLAVNSAVKVELASTALPPAAVKSIASDILIEGAPSSDWWARQAADLQARFTDQIRRGMLAGESLGQLAQRIRGTKAAGYKDGVMGIPTQSAEKLIRTSVQTVANDARFETYRLNDDVVRGVQWVATLDNRTSIICMALNGKVWDLDKKPVGHKQPWPGPTAHWNCRSTQIPVLKSWDELAAEGFDVPQPDESKVNKLFKQNLKDMGFDDAEISKIIRDGRSSMDGQVAKDLTFDAWLRRKPKAMQNEMLGETKAELWRQKKITLAEMIDQKNRPLTIDEIKKKLQNRRNKS